MRSEGKAYPIDIVLFLAVGQETGWERGLTCLADFREVELASFYGDGDAEGEGRRK